MNYNHKGSELKIGAVLSYVQMGLKIIIGILYTPIMIRLLGQNEYGLYNTVASTISTLSILNLGFNASYVRYFSKYNKDNNLDKIYSLNGMFILVFSVIGIIALACGLYFTKNLDLIFKDGLTENEYSVAKVLMLLLAFKLAISFPMGVFSNIISAHERFIFMKTIGIISVITSPLVCLPLLLKGYKSIAIVVVSLIVQTLCEIANFYYVVFKLKNKFVFKNFERGLFKSMFAYSGLIALNIVVNQINWNIDKILLARFKGTAEVAVYSVGFSLYSYYQNFSSSISGVFTPRIHKIVAENKNVNELKEKLTNLFVRVGRIQFLILALIVTGVILFGKAFITEIWAGKDYSSSYSVALLLMVPATIPLIQNVGIEIQRAENNHYFRSVFYSIMALLNLGITMLLAPKFGAAGAAFGTALSLLIANGLVMNIFYNNKCHIDIIEFWRNIFSISKSFFIIIPIGLILKYFLDFTKVYQLFIGIIIYIIVYVFAMWRFGMNEYEKGLFSTLWKKFKNKDEKNV